MHDKFSFSMYLIHTIHTCLYVNIETYVPIRKEILREEVTLDKIK